MPASAGRTTAAGATVMSIGGQSQVPHTYWHLLARRDVLAGLLFVGVALLGLWLSRDYPIGTALRMGTGYVPRLLCGLVLSILLLIGVGSVAARELRPIETGMAALVLIALSWGIFILGLGLTIPVWPEW